MPPRVYLDTNVFITAFENSGARADHARWILRAIDAGKIAGVTSELTLAEILVTPFEHGDLELASTYETMIASGPNFEVPVVRRDILMDAAKVRVGRAMKLPDAIHLATARACSCSHIVSDDRRMAGTDGISVLAVTPFTVDDILRES